MTQTEMFGKAQWVAPSSDCSGPYLRREFDCGEFKSASISICGLGFFELYINGKKVSDDLLVPANSQFEKRNLAKFGYPITDTLSYRTYCLRYDLTDYLRAGKNAVGVRLGNGWYNQSRYKSEGDVRYGSIKLCFRIEIVNDDLSVSEILSDGKMKWSQSEIVSDNIYLGEQHDYSLEKMGYDTPGFDDSDWNAVCEAPAPDCDFQLQTCPADKVIRTIIPVEVKNLGDVTIYDAGEAVSGFAVVRSDGGRVTVRYADELLDDCSLTFDSTGGDNKIQQDIFENVSDGRDYYPRFCWHAFRYFEVSNNAKPEKVLVVHSDCPVTSSFDSDSEVLNWLYKTYLRTQLDNMHCGVPSDCPHIERLGYTGDGQLCAEAAMLMLDSREFYRKWLGDISDCQDVKNGHVQHTAPFMGGGGGPAAWGGAIVVVPYMFYRCYGEKDILDEFLPKILKYFDYMLSRSEDGLVVREEEGGWCLGDWCAPVAYNLPEPHVKSRCLIPEAYVNTALFVKFMQMAIEMSEIIGKSEMTAHLPAVIDRCKRALKNAYYSPMFNCFCGDVQGASSYAADIGMGDSKLITAIVQKYSKHGMLDTGIVATDILPRILFETGNEQLAFDLMTSKGDISFHYMMAHGATTLWEDWHPERSRNHPMFGALTRYLFTYFLGIRQQPGSAGFEKPLISPCLVDGMDRASGYITTVRGKIEVSYVKNKNSADFTVTLPEGVSAVFEFGGKTSSLKQGKNVLSVSLS